MDHFTTHTAKGSPFALLYRHLRSCAGPLAVPLVTLGLALCALGCNRGPEYAPVTGTVHYRDKPVLAGGITFEPAEGRSAFGSIKDGKIVDVSTYKPGDGVRVGKARVGIQSTTNLGLPTGPHTPLIPPHYFDPNTSQLTVEIQAGGPNQLEFKLVDPAR